MKIPAPSSPSLLRRTPSYSSETLELLLPLPSSWARTPSLFILSPEPLGERPLVELYLEPGVFPNDARKNCPFVWTSFTGWSSERCPGIGFLSRGDREIGVLRNVEPPTRPRLEGLRTGRGARSQRLGDLLLEGLAGSCR